jgi:hypothetical protein
MDISVEDEHNRAENEFLAHKSMTVSEANIVGRAWRKRALEERNKGVKEKHLSRAESRRIAESKMFPSFIKDVINPLWETFQNCDFEAQEGLMEMGLQLERSKIRVLRNSSEPLFGLKEAADEGEMLRRKAVAEKERVCFELIKPIQLVMDLPPCRKVDLRIAEQEGDVCETAVIVSMREKKMKTLKKCIARLARLMKPIAPDAPERAIGLSKEQLTWKQIQGYQMEGMDVDEDMPNDKEKKPILDAEELYYFSHKETNEEFEEEAKQAWLDVEDGVAYRSCLSIRKHVYANDVDWLADPGSRGYYRRLKR